MQDRNNIKSILEEIVGLFEKEQITSVHLRKILVFQRSNMFNADSNIEKFIGFYLYILIEHLLYVLSGDIQYEKDSAIYRDEIFKKLIELLKFLTNTEYSLDARNTFPSLFLKYNTEFIECYFDQLQNINPLLREGK